MKTTKRILAVLMAVMLIFALSVTSVSATGTATLNVTGDTLGTKNVTIVPMFTKTGANGTYELADGWAGFFTDKVTVTGADDPTLPTKAFQYVEAIDDDSDDMVTFAKAAKVYYLANTADFTSTARTLAATSGTATFTALEDGSYLILPESGSTDERGTDAIIKNVAAANNPNTVNLKSVYPTVDKTVSADGTNFTDDTAAGVGDTVTFKLEAEVPDMSEYDEYYFSFLDTMTNLDYVPSSVTVNIKNKDTDAETELTTGYTVTEPGVGEYDLTINFGNLKYLVANNDAINEGDTIIVTYNATIADSAVTTGSGTNTVVLNYSNDPSHPENTVPSTPDITTVYVYDLVIDKYDGTTNDKLAGAVFEISKTSGGTAIQLVTTTTANTYRVATAEEIAGGNTITQVVTPSTGLITILGLDADTYYVKEVAPPLGYNGIDTPIEVVITASGTTVTYTVDGTEQADHTVEVENNAGVTLPTTGSVGTIIFTVIGVGVIIAGVMFTSRKKKENE